MATGKKEDVTEQMEAILRQHTQALTAERNALQAQVDELEKQQILHEKEVIKYICALDIFKLRCVGLSYEKNIIEAVERFTCTSSEDEHFESKPLTKHKQQKEG